MSHIERTEHTLCAQSTEKTGHTVGMISLGCSKNQVDAEHMLALLDQAGFEITADEASADAVIVNTCGFIADAKREGIDAILDIARQKQEGRLKALIVTGCMAERYREQVRQEMPEVDVVVGLGANGDIVDIVSHALNGRPADRYAPKCQLPLEGERLLINAPYYAYLKIADGCDNRCSYCAIPLIRGSLRSRPIEACVDEARRLADRGVKELIVVAQDTTRYGEDLYGQPMLPELLTLLCSIDGLRWIRIVYAYPERISDQLLAVMATQEKLVRYIDLPIQHCSDRILKAMNRCGDRQSLEGVIARIRKALPDVTLRTTLIAGFPGEETADFEELAQFVHDMRFDRLGCFTYSAEEDTPAATFAHQVDEEVKQERQQILLREQSLVTEALNQAKIGRVEEVLIEGYDPYIKQYFGRTHADAPDIDCKIYFTSPRRLSPGEFVSVKVTGALEYDLLGEESS